MYRDMSGKSRIFNKVPISRGTYSTPSRGSCEDAYGRDRFAGCTVALDKSTDTTFCRPTDTVQLLVYVRAVNRDNSGIGRVQEVWTYSNE